MRRRLRSLCRSSLLLKISYVFERRLAVSEVGAIIMRSAVVLLHPALFHSEFVEKGDGAQPFRFGDAAREQRVALVGCGAVRRVILRHERDGDARTQSFAYPFERVAHARDVVRKNEKADDEAATQDAVVVEDQSVARLTKHLLQSGARVLRVVRDFGEGVAV